MSALLRRLAPLALLLSLASPAYAQLTDAQMVTLRAAIEADPTLNAIPNTYPAGAEQLAAALNATASPAFIVWKSNVTIGDVGRTFNATELAGLTALNHTRLQTLAIYMSSGVNPSNAPVRAFFDDIFSGTGGVNTRAALLALWKRSARRIERIFATGTGTDAAPATLVFEGTITAITAHNSRGAQ